MFFSRLNYVHKENGKVNDTVLSELRPGAVPD